MDHDNKKWKKWLPGLLSCPARLVIIIVLGGTFAFRHEIRTPDTLERIDDNVLYLMRYDGDYGLDDFLKTGTSTDGELARSVTEQLLEGLPFEFSIPDFGYSTFSAWTKEGDYISRRSFGLTCFLAPIAKTAPDHGYRSLLTISLVFLGFEEDNPPDSLREKLIALAAPYAPLDGINEKGLVAAVLCIVDGSMNQNAEKMDITTITATRLMLDRAVAVDEAVELLEQYDIRSSARSYYYFQIADVGGSGVVVEYVDDELVVLKVEQDYQMATNFPLSDKKYNFEDDQDRYEILETPLDSCSGVVEDEQAGMDLLWAASRDWYVFEPSGRMNVTQWSVVFNCMDLTAKIITGRQCDEPVHEFSLDQ